MIVCIYSTKREFLSTQQENIYLVQINLVQLHALKKKQYDVMSTSLHVIPDYTNSLTCCDIDAMLNEKSMIPKPLLMGKTSFDITYSAASVATSFYKGYRFYTPTSGKGRNFELRHNSRDGVPQTYQKVHSNYMENLEKSMNKRLTQNPEKSKE